jgi:hypothetical protein
MRSSSWNTEVLYIICCAAASRKGGEGLWYRISHPGEKRMIYPKEGDAVTINNDGEIEYWCGSTRCDIRWFTDLKDKNGKEIYERYNPKLWMGGMREAAYPSA